MSSLSDICLDVLKKRKEKIHQNLFSLMFSPLFFVYLFNEAKDGSKI